MHRLDSVWGDLRSEWAASVGEGMASFYQRLERGGCVLFSHQDVVGVESGDRKYRNASLGQGLEKGSKDSRQREREWACELEAGPRRLTFCVWRSLIGGADDG